MSCDNETLNEMKDLGEFFCPFCHERLQFNLVRNDILIIII